jgi:hypothetical protein
MIHQLGTCCTVESESEMLQYAVYIIQQVGMQSTWLMLQYFTPDVPFAEVLSCSALIYWRVTMQGP